MGHFLSFFAVVNSSRLDADPTLAFRGFFIQARLVADDSNVGGFLEPLAGQEYQLSSCVPSTVRHYCLPCQSQAVFSVRCQVSVVSHHSRLVPLTSTTTPKPLLW